MKQWGRTLPPPSVWWEESGGKESLPSPPAGGKEVGEQAWSVCLGIVMEDFPFLAVIYINCDGYSWLLGSRNPHKYLKHDVLTGSAVELLKRQCINNCSELQWALLVSTRRPSVMHTELQLARERVDHNSCNWPSSLPDISLCGGGGGGGALYKRIIHHSLIAVLCLLCFFWVGGGGRDIRKKFHEHTALLPSWEFVFFWTRGKNSLRHWLPLLNLASLGMEEGKEKSM